MKQSYCNTYWTTYCGSIPPSQQDNASHHSATEEHDMDRNLSINLNMFLRNILRTHLPSDVERLWNFLLWSISWDKIFFIVPWGKLFLGSASSLHYRTFISRHTWTASLQSFIPVKKTKQYSCLQQWIKQIISVKVGNKKMINNMLITVAQPGSIFEFCFSGFTSFSTNFNTVFQNPNFSDMNLCLTKSSHKRTSPE